MGLGGVHEKIKSADEEETAQLGREDANSTEELMFSFSDACVRGIAPFFYLIKNQILYQSRRLLVRAAKV